MYTRCPFCHTTFTVSGAHLRSGRGTVRCGRCRKLFDALAYLSDTLAGFEAPAAGAQAPQPRAGAGERATPTQRPGSGRQTPPRANEKPSAERPPTLQQSLSDEEQAIPQALREDMARIASVRRRSRGRFLLGVASVLLVGALAFQYAWFMPEDVVHRYPPARLWMEAFCGRTGCILPPRRDPGQIRMVSRDVRVHPKYEGALLVTATLENMAPYTQPYPQMQFTLYNVNGQTIATRRFRPREYLSAGVDVAKGMPSHTPVQIALDLLAPEQAAVSFEFRFL